MDIRRFLSTTSPFNVLPPAELDRLALTAHRSTVSKGDRVYNEGDRAQFTFLVLGGRVQITRLARDGRPLTVELLKSGELFGCVGCSAAGQYPCEALAGQTTEIIGFPMAIIVALIDRYPAFSRALYCDMSRRMRESQNMRALGAESVERRVAGVLLWLESKFGPDLPFTRQAIAELASTTPESAIRTLIQFRRRGFIKTGWKKIVLQRTDALKELVEGVAA